MRRTGNLVGKNGLESGCLTRALEKDQGAAAGAGRESCTPSQAGGTRRYSRGGWGGGPGVSQRGDGEEAPEKAAHAPEGESPQVAMESWVVKM